MLVKKSLGRPNVVEACKGEERLEGTRELRGHKQYSNDHKEGAHDKLDVQLFNYFQAFTMLLTDDSS